VPYSSPNMRAMDKWRSRANSACFKGANVSIDKILIVVGKGTGGHELVWQLDFYGILNVLSYRARTKRRLDKWSRQADSAHQIGPEAISFLLLIVG
jgi:hypothetical protein